jgi:class 3 adenylate cyclase
MPLFMDIHDGLTEATAEDVQTAHKRDLEVQHKYGVRYLTYWFNDPGGQAFCLVEAPDRAAAIACHREAHGLLPHKLIEVSPPTLASFVGNWEGSVPDRATIGGPGTAPDTGIRTLMFTDIEGSTDISTQEGDELAMQIVREHDRIVRQSLAACMGTEVKHTGDGMLACFLSVTRAVDCALEIQACVERSTSRRLRVRIGMSAGEPVAESDDLYGAAVNLAARVCAVAKAGQVLVSSVVKELAIGKRHKFVRLEPARLKGFEDPVQLYEVARE